MLVNFFQRRFFYYFGEDLKRDEDLKPELGICLSFKKLLHNEFSPFVNVDE